MELNFIAPTVAAISLQSVLVESKITHLGINKLDQTYMYMYWKRCVIFTHTNTIFISERKVFLFENTSLGYLHNISFNISLFKKYADFNEGTLFYFYGNRKLLNNTKNYHFVVQQCGLIFITISLVK